MPIIILEVSGERHDKLVYYRYDAARITVGRGFMNDLILPDIHISAEHALLEWTPEGWTVRDLKSENGIYSEQRKSRLDGGLLRPAEVLRLGKTRLRVLPADYPVPPARPISVRDKSWLRYIDTNSATLFIVSASALASILLEYLQSSDNAPEAVRVILGGVSLLIGAGIWASLWALIGRICRAKPKFFLQMNITCLTTYATFTVYQFAAFLGYNFSSQDLEGGLMAALVAGIMVFSLMLHLEAATDLSLVKRIKFSAILVFIVYGLGGLFALAALKEFDPGPRMHGTLRAPLFKFAAGHSLEEFVKKSGEVFSEAREMNKERK